MIIKLFSNNKIVSVTSSLNNMCSPQKGLMIEERKIINAHGLLQVHRIMRGRTLSLAHGYDRPTGGTPLGVFEFVNAAGPTRQSVTVQRATTLSCGFQC